MLVELLYWDTVVLVHLKALDEEQARLNVNRFVETDFVAPIINLCYQIFHLKTVEGRDADEHFIEHNSEGPSVDLLTITALFKQLWTRVERCAADT